jgi:hypothetical protein
MQQKEKEVMGHGSEVMGNGQKAQVRGHGLWVMGINFLGTAALLYFL